MNMLLALLNLTSYGPLVSIASLSVCCEVHVCFCPPAFMLALLFGLSPTPDPPPQNMIAPRLLWLSSSKICRWISAKRIWEMDF
jgi:hypothetical protein